MKKRGLTIIGRVLQTRISNKTNGSMKPLRITQTVHNHQYLIAPQLALDTLQRAFQAQPKVDFLRGGSGGYIPIEFSDRLDGLYPRVYVGVEGVKER